MVNLRFVVSWVLKILMWGGIVSIGWMVFSCEEFCEESNRTAVVIGFYTEADGASLTVTNLEIKGVENDSVLYNKSSNAQILLPVNPVLDSMRFVIINNGLPADTIRLNYVRHNGFISPKCGCTTYAEIQERSGITGHSIVRMEIVSPHATTVSYRQGVINAENIRIYY